MGRSSIAFPGEVFGNDTTPGRAHSCTALRIVDQPAQAGHQTLNIAWLHQLNTIAK
jgi:hypothetical protein